MGASVVAYWPGITEEQMETMPGFWNDDRAWGNWMAERDGDPKVLEAVTRLGAEAIMTLKTDGWEDEDVAWASPEQLRDAATKLRVAVESQAPEAAIILETYERSANCEARVCEEFIRDLDDVITLTKWAEAQGATKMTLEVNW